MKALCYDGTQAVYTEDREIPKPGDTESLVRILVSGVCNTDKEILKGYRPDFRGVMGHEFIGIVEESKDPFWVGKRVAGEINAGCQNCLYCKTGREKHCESRRTLGMSGGKDGCFAEYMTIENHLLHEVPESLPTEVAVFTEPLAAALEILSQVHIKPESKTALIGDGRLAFMIAQVLALTGTDLTVIGKHEEKLELFKEYGKTVTKTEETFDNVVDATGSASGIELALKIVRRQGVIILKSTYSGLANVDMTSLVVNEITLVGSRCGPFEPALKLLASGRVKLPDVKLYDLKDFGEAFSSPEFKAGFLIGRE
ncbi:alcohol dehydrogenase catalytic domain-containing protein [Clostridium sp. MCC353]|uniref:MDR/zinc-dependent alcohol dehydrogenase-like family protein n=1 Tax=Clostridium sp. MCC353 TaxID=2592646 RepID=UPI001C017B5C|nr:alcohol dehydrogenase catalytic domain-containing protein [Clostridium sp. MCC353]